MKKNIIRSIENEKFRKIKKNYKFQFKEKLYDLKN